MKSYKLPTGKNYQPHQNNREMKEVKKMCSTYAVKTGRHCPEDPIKQIGNFLLCEKCSVAVNGRGVIKWHQEQLKTK